VNFLDAIRRGSTLKKVSEEDGQNKSLTGKGGGRGSGSSLGAFGSSAVTAILERRKFVVESDESDSDSDKDNWD
jgi:hypothetical protein